LAAGLIASNVTRPERLDRCEAHLSEWVRRLKESGCTAGPARQRAEAVFEFLHREVLRGGYRVEDTNVAAVFDEGRFNCVTASLLFHCLAERCGLVVYGVEMPGHAMSRVLLPEGPLDVETTCPQWFRVTEDRRKAADAVVKAAGGAPHSAHAAREVTGIELVAMVYYNRGIDLLRQKRFAEALAVNAKALRLDPASAAARANLLATLNNWAIHLATEGQFSEAAILMRRGLALDAAHGPLRANYAYLCRQWREAPALPAP
jgi:tetratricopeptide (TPR) repeat protein